MKRAKEIVDEMIADSAKFGFCRISHLVSRGDSDIHTIPFEVKSGRRLVCKINGRTVSRAEFITKFANMSARYLKDEVEA